MSYRRVWLLSRFSDAELISFTNEKNESQLKKTFRAAKNRLSHIISLRKSGLIIKRKGSSVTEYGSNVLSTQVISV